MGEKGREGQEDWDHEHQSSFEMTYGSLLLYKLPICVYIHKGKKDFKCFLKKLFAVLFIAYSKAIC